MEEDELDEGSKQEVEQSDQEANMAGMQNIQVEQMYYFASGERK